MKVKYIVTTFLVAVIFVLIISIVQQIFNTYGVQSRILALKTRVEVLKSQQQQFLSDKVRKNEQSYMEEQIRDKLHLIKPGEVLAILPKEIQQQKNETYLNTDHLTKSGGQEVSLQSNFDKWYRLFF